MDYPFFTASEWREREEELRARRLASDRKMRKRDWPSPEDRDKEFGRKAKASWLKSQKKEVDPRDRFERLNSKRIRERRLLLEQPQPETLDLGVGEELLEWSEEEKQRRLNLIRSTLDEDEYQILLQQQAGYTFKEIAAKLGIKEETARKRRQRARDKLKAKLGL